MKVDSIASELPYLRRFARALSGNQSSGDAYVGSTLESLLADPSAFDADADLPPRVALYRVFLKVWNAIKVNNMTDTTSIEDTHVADKVASSDRRLETLTPLPRQAFLLVALEGFSPADAARVLDLTEDEIGGLISEAGAEIAAQIASEVLIIEDEPLIALDLEQLVEDIGHRVLEVARTHREAVAAVGRRKPGLVLADIQLADGSSGVDAVNEILTDLSAPVIFITAYPERLLTGERPEPVFIITKPFQPETVKAVISQALFFDQVASRRAARAL